MSKITITLNDRNYQINCGEGEEAHARELVAYVESKIREVAAGTTNASENQLLVLTCLLLADELAETHQNYEKTQKSNENLMVAAVNHLHQRVANIANQVGRA